MSMEDSGQRHTAVSRESTYLETNLLTHLLDCLFFIYYSRGAQELPSRMSTDLDLVGGGRARHATILPTSGKDSIIGTDLGKFSTRLSQPRIYCRAEYKTPDHYRISKYGLEPRPT